MSTLFIDEYVILTEIKKAKISNTSPTSLISKPKRGMYLNAALQNKAWLANTW